MEQSPSLHAFFPFLRFSIFFSHPPICSLLFRCILFFSIRLYPSLDRPNRRSFSLESGRAGQTKDRREEKVGGLIHRREADGRKRQRTRQRYPWIYRSRALGDSSSSSIRRISDLENSLRSTDKSGVVDPLWPRCSRHGSERVVVFGGTNRLPIYPPNRARQTGSSFKFTLLKRRSPHASRLKYSPDKTVSFPSQSIFARPTHSRL